MNGRELLGYYTMAQTSFLLFLTVLVGMSICMAWTVAEEEVHERMCAEEWLRRENKEAYLMREEVVKRFGKPGSVIRPEGDVTWPKT